jgi:hypothetical protein
MAGELAALPDLRGYVSVPLEKDDLTEKLGWRFGAMKHCEGKYGRTNRTTSSFCDCDAGVGGTCCGKCQKVGVACN